MLELLLQLEMSLWIKETRYNKDYLNTILHPSFKEFGMSGKTYHKKDILKSKPTELDIKFPLKNVDIQDINGNYLITYSITRVINNIEQTSNRSSLWLCEGETCQLLFHQGTKQ